MQSKDNSAFMLDRAITRRSLNPGEISEELISGRSLNPVEIPDYDEISMRDSMVLEQMPRHVQAAEYQHDEQRQVSDSQLDFAVNSDSEMTMIDSEFPPDLSDEQRMNQLAQSNNNPCADAIPEQASM